MHASLRQISHANVHKAVLLVSHRLPNDVNLDIAVGLAQVSLVDINYQWLTSSPTASCFLRRDPLVLEGRIFSNHR